MTTFREMLIATEEQLIVAGVFCGHGYESEHDEAVALVLTAASRSIVNTGAEILDEPYPDFAASVLNTFMSKRCIERLPVAYITGGGLARSALLQIGCSGIGAAIACC